MRKALVIGAGSGMGAAVAERFHRDGYDLVLADIAADRLEAQKQAYGAVTASVDITDGAALAALADLCGEGIDALVLTAGLSMSMAPFDRIMEVNLGGSALVLETLGSRVREGGAAVCLASIAGHMAGPQPAAIEAALDDPLAPELGERVGSLLGEGMRIPGMAYALSKLGVLRLVQRSAAPFGARGVRVNSVSPGLVDTPMGSLERKSNAGAEAAVMLGPIPRLGGPDEIAGVIAFLCSADARYVTGTDIIVDGGWVGAIRSATPDSPIAQAMAAGRAKS